MEQLTIRRLGLLLAAFSGLVVIRSLFDGPLHAVATVLLLLPMLIAVGRYAGSWLVLAGSLGNCLVVAVNGAMPVSITAVHLAGLLPDGRPVIFDSRHTKLTPARNLPALGDVLPVPGYAVSSIGDVLMAAGLALLAYTLARGPHLDAPADAQHPTRLSEVCTGSEPGRCPGQCTHRATKSVLTA